MGWLIEFAVELGAQLFGYAVGRNGPWWVEFVATLGCLATLAVPLLLLWLLLR